MRSAGRQEREKINMSFGRASGLSRLSRNDELASLEMHACIVLAPAHCPTGEMWEVLFF